jgi:hypothetical protein
MNRDMLHYYLGSLADATDLSPQCARVRDLMLAEKIGDQDRLDAVLDFLDGREPISDDTVQWLRRGIRGHYGGEGNVLDVSAESEASFSLTLHDNYPNNAWLCFVAADARFGCGYPEALHLFFRAFELDSSLVHKLGGDVCEFIADSEYRFDMELIRLADAVSRKDTCYLHETLAEFRREYREDMNALRRIEQVVSDA